MEFREDFVLADLPGLGVALPNRFRHGGFHVAGAYGVDGDPGGREFVAEGFGESDDAVFGSGVGRAQDHSLLAGGRGDVDDASPGGFAHSAGGEHFPGYAEHTGEVGGEDVVPQVVGDVGGDPASPASRVVDEDADGAEAFDRGADHGPDVVEGADVAGLAVDGEIPVVGELFGGFRYPFPVAGADEDTVAPVGQFSGHSEPDAAGGSGDDRGSRCGCHVESSENDQGQAAAVMRLTRSMSARRVSAAARSSSAMRIP